MKRPSYSSLDSSQTEASRATKLSRPLWAYIFRLLTERKFGDYDKLAENEVMVKSCSAISDPKEGFTRNALKATIIKIESNV